MILRRYRSKLAAVIVVVSLFMPIQLVKSLVENTTGPVINSALTFQSSNKAEVKQTPQNLTGRIAFALNGNIWIANPDGTEQRQLTTMGNCSEPAWSPDGYHIAYIHIYIVQPSNNEAFEIRIIDVTNNQDQIAVPAEPAIGGKYYRYSYPRWSPDRNALYFIATDGRASGYYFHKYDLITHQKDHNFYAHTARSIDVSWTDGRLLFFEYDNYLVEDWLEVANPDGSGVWTLIPEEPGAIINAPCWSPDGSHVAYIDGYYNQSHPIAVITSMNTDRHDYIPSGNLTPTGLSWSPDGNHIIYDADGFLYILDLSNGLSQLIIAGEDPSWGIGFDSISGHITEINTLNPIPGVIISDGLGHTTVTDNNGDYRLSGLSAGSYTITPLSNGFSFSPTSRTVIVPPDALGQNFTGKWELSISHIEVTQGIQDEENNVPLIAGKPTIVRVNLQSNGEDIDGVYGTLFMSNNGGSTWMSTQAENTPSTAVSSGMFDRENDHYSLRFTLPKSMWYGNVLIYAEAYVDLKGTRTISLQNDLNFIPVAPISIGYISIPYKGVFPDVERISRAQYYLNSLYPIQTVNYFHLPVSIPDWGSKSDSELKNTLNEIYIWYELFGWPGPNGRPDKLFGWLPDSTLGIGGSSDPTWYGGLGRVAFGSDTPENNLYQVILAHEIGHLYNLEHPCDDSFWQSQWPGEYNIHDVGFDFGFYRTNMLVRAKTDEMMTGTHCNVNVLDDKWISAYSSKLLYAEFTRNITGAIAQPNRPLQILTGEPILIVSGTVNDNNTATLDPAYQILPLQPYTQPEGTVYCLILEDGIGTSLTSSCFNLSFIDPEAGTPLNNASFVRVLPYNPLAARLVLRQAGQQLAEIKVSAHSPTVSLLSPNGGETFNGIVDVTWTAGDLDGDALTYAIFYSRDNGQSWYHLGSGITDTHILVDTKILSGSDQALFRIIATDGINTTSDASDSTFTVARKVPQAFILSPEQGITIPVGSSLILQGSASDLEDGPLPDAAFQWSSDKDGYLGEGKDLLVDLSYGYHLITLTVVDSDGNIATDDIHIFVGTRIFLPLSMKG